MFGAASVMILNKIDLLPYVEFDVARAIANAKQINPDIVVLRLSGRTGEGLEAWYEWLRREVDALRDAAFA
jgi:hydrogenase nickel incorporation protein HypB